MKRKFKCEIDCANCAAKAEDAIRKIDGVIDVKINFMTQKFTLEAEDARYDEVFAAAVAAAKRVEPDFAILD